MECWTCKSNTGEKRISPGPTIFEGNYWLVEDTYPIKILGWLVIVLKRHAEALHELTAEEFIELEPVCKIGKEENRSNGNHGSEIHSSLFITSGNASELLETIDESFNNISFSVVLFIERTSAPFVAASSNGVANMITMEIA